METLTWIAHPARARKRAAALTLIFMLIIFVVVYLISLSPWMVVLAAAIFVGSLSTFFFPTRYELSREKIKVKYLFTTIVKDMSMYRSFYPDKNGLLLSPFVRPSRLENFRGLYIKYHRNKDEVDAFVKRIFEERADGN